MQSRVAAISPPRPMQMRKDEPSVGCVQLFLIPHTLIGLGILGYIVITVLAIFFGHDAEATVTRKWTTRGSKNSTSYHVAYTSRDPELSASGETTVSAAEFDSAREGSTLVFRCYQAGPFPRFVQTSSGLWRMAFFMLLFDTFWMGILSVFYWAMYGARLTQWNLLKHGTATAGRLTEVTPVPGKTPTVRLHYRYSAMGEQEGRMTVTPSRAAGAEPGQEVTVLYAPTRPQRSYIYEYGVWEV